MHLHHYPKIALGLSLFFLLTQLGHAKPDPIRVLIVDGYNNHDWQRTTQWLLAFMAQDPLIESSVSTIPPLEDPNYPQWLPPFQQYDVVIQNTNDIRNKQPWPQPAQQSFEQYIEQGGGMFVLHSANNAFPKWKAYNRMIGIGWRPKHFGSALTIENKQPVLIPPGQGDRTGHSKRQDSLITRLGQHPIHQNLPQQWLAADLEVYRYPRGPAQELTVLSYALESKTQLHFPVEWAVQYGEGRVYISTYGHLWHNSPDEPAGMRCAAWQTILRRALYWLAQREVPCTVPKTFPSTTQTSLHPPILKL